MFPRKRLFDQGERVIHRAEEKHPYKKGNQSRPAADRVQVPLVMLNRQLDVVASNQQDLDAGRGEARGMSELIAELASGASELRARIDNLIQDGGLGSQALEWRDSSGSQHSLGLTAIFPDADDYKSPAFILISDDTRQLAAARNLEDLIEQQQLQLLETRHRMKNGLQVIASILRIKTHLCGSTELRAHFEDVHRRVLSIAALEDQLDPLHGMESNLVKPYLFVVCDRLAASVIGPDRGVELRVIAADLQMRPEMIVSIGLVVTELVINSMKHAFGPASNGTIVVTLAGDGTSWTLSVSDTGRGCRSDALQSSSGLGTRIIRALARRLNAQLTISPNEPTGLRVALTHPRRMADATEERG